LLIVSLACSRLGDDASQSTDYDALSLFVLSLSSAGAGGILTTRIFDRISKAQELYAQQTTIPTDSQACAAISKRGRLSETAKSIGVSLLLIVALATAIFPTLPSTVWVGISSHSLP
jgi:hypothetical protein